MPELRSFPNLATINDILLLVASRKENVAVLRRDAKGAWQPVSGDELYRAVAALTRSLKKLGIVQGDRIALIAENRWEWAATDFAALAMGAVDVPIYPTLTAEQTGALLADSGSRIAVVSTRKQYEKVAAVRHRTRLEHIVVMDNESLPDTLNFHDLLGLIGDAEDATEAFEQQASDIQPGDLATIIYTSGTTGEPKGVMLTHGNLASNVNCSSVEFDFGEIDSCISFLPLSHITARHVDYLLLARGATLAYCPFFEQLPAAMASLKPTVLIAVPRVYEKIMQEVKRRSAQSPVKARVLAWALSTGKRHRATILADRTPASPLWKLAGKLVFSKVRQVFGGRVRYFISGGAPLGLDTAEWFADAGIHLFEGFGLTETSPVIALSSPRNSRLGSVGKLVSNIGVRLAPDGELLVKGPSVFEAYWQNPAETAAAFDGDGWFRTGDMAHLDADGFLFITDRKKELLKTSGGKFIAPTLIENKLKASALVGSAAVVGDRHKFASALISPNFAALEDWARTQKIQATTRSELVALPEVKALYRAAVQAANAHLANFEKIKRFHIVPDEWSIETGEMTPSMKLKRRVVLERYVRDIEAFYADESTSRDPTQPANLL
jgi:long-chain acyl-CoA synthetase